MKFKYIGGPSGHEYYQGLPAADLDTVDLNPEQMSLLQEIASTGVYEMVKTSKPAPEKAKTPDDGSNKSSSADPS